MPFSLSMKKGCEMKLRITGADFFVCRDDLPADMAESLSDCLTQGRDALPEVQAFLDAYGIDCDPDLAKAYLRPYGAWDEAGLESHSANLERLAWLIGCDLAEHGEAYLSVY